jgi:hypothetical protein
MVNEEESDLNFDMSGCVEVFLHKNAIVVEKSLVPLVSVNEQKDMKKSHL